MRLIEIYFKFKKFQISLIIYIELLKLKSFLNFIKNKIIFISYLINFIRIIEILIFVILKI